MRQADLQLEQYSFIHHINQAVLLIDSDYNFIDANEIFHSTYNSSSDLLIKFRLTDPMRHENEINDESHSVKWKFHKQDADLILAFGTNYKEDTIDYKKEYEDFLYIVSHDLNEPARTIKSFTEFLKADLGDNIDNKTSEDLEFISDGVKRLETRLKGLLELSRITRSSEITKSSRIAHLISELSDEQRWTDVTVCETEDSPLIIDTSEVLLKKCLAELINNGIKFNQSKNKHISIQLSPQKIRITDNGVGFELNQFKNMIKPFHKLHGVHTCEGAGIGLTIVQKICDKLQINLAAESNHQGGSTFILSWEK